MISLTGKARSKWIICAFALLAWTVSSMAQEIAIKNGQRLAFLGDSITQQGTEPSGYARLVINGLAANGIQVEPVFAGISGNKSNDMLARLDRDVISKNPDLMTLSCGVNDVWHGDNGIPLDQYKINIAAIVDKAQKANIKVVILTATMIGEDQSNANNQKLVPYNEFLRSLAKERNLPLADLNAEMQSAVKQAALKWPKPSYGIYLTTDGVHMHVPGNIMMAEGVLRALGLNAEQMAKANASWLDVSCNVSSWTSISIGQYNKLREMAAEHNLSINDYLKSEFTKFIAEELKK